MEPNMLEAGQSPGVYRCDQRRVFTFSLPRASTEQSYTLPQKELRDTGHEKIVSLSYLLSLREIGSSVAQCVGCQLVWVFLPAKLQAEARDML